MIIFSLGKDGLFIVEFIVKYISCVFITSYKFLSCCYI